MTPTSQQSQTVPLQVHQADNRLVLAAPMPGLEPQGIAVIISGNRVTIRGGYRGSRQNQPEILISEWTIGPYYREVVLPGAVPLSRETGSSPWEEGRDTKVVLRDSRYGL